MTDLLVNEGTRVQGLDVPAKRLLILGTRGIPAAHGGFETFAEKLSLYLVARGWSVTVYCQADGGKKIFGQPEIDMWKGVRRVTIATSMSGPFGTLAFDWASIAHALKEPGLPLVLGYNTALFAARLRLAGRPLLMNMDGIEWKRSKWGLIAKIWFYLNEWSGARISDKLIADHPAIAYHLGRIRKRSDIVTIAYGADSITEAPLEPVRAFGVEPGRYFLSIGRIEPENSILEIVKAYSAKPRQNRYICVGALDPEHNSYHAAVLEAAKGGVLFPGSLYDQSVVRALRFHALAYCHGHTVGGTNPSLVESLGAGCAVVAHDNVFNKWVAGEEQLYFSDVDSCAQVLDRVEADSTWRQHAKAKTRQRHESQYTWEHILRQYETLLSVYQQDMVI